MAHNCRWLRPAGGVPECRHDGAGRSTGWSRGSLPAPSAGALGEAAHQRRCRGQRWPQDSYRTLPPAREAPSPIRHRLEATEQDIVSELVNGRSIFCGANNRRSRVTPKGRRPGNITFGDSTGPGFMAAGSERHLALLGRPLRARGGPLRMGRCPGISRRALPRSAGSGLPGRSRPE